MSRKASVALLALLALIALTLASCAGGAAPQASAPTAPAPTAAQPTMIQPTAVPLPAAATPAAPQRTAAPIIPTETAAPAPAADLSALQVTLEPVATGLTLPVDIVSAGDGSGRLFVVDKPGTIRIIQNGALLDTPFLDIRGEVGSRSTEQGLLGLAFHPQYAQNGFFFIDYTDRNGNTVVSRFHVSADPNQADPSSEEVILTQAQPAVNHNGGDVMFGPDGNLYIGFGDGGGAGDTYHNGQNRMSWLGTLLRINVDTLPYTVPADNPFVGDAGALPEIWAFGLRNPWRFSFDRQTGDLYIGDVGQNIYEEVDVQLAGSAGGQNYGWPIMEGLHCYDASTCDQTGLTLPVAEYDHSQGCAISGGYVYRGSQYPQMQGVYLFGDYCSGIIWGLAQDASGTWWTAQLASPSISLSAFGQDEQGELYAADLSGGVIYLVAAR